MTAIYEDLIAELNKYDCRAYITRKGTISFENSPELDIHYQDSLFIVSFVNKKTSQFVEESFSQPLQVVFYILKGVYKYEIN